MDTLQELRGSMAAAAAAAELRQETLQFNLQDMQAQQMGALCCILALDQCLEYT